MTSGSTNFSQTRNEVILDALALIGVNSVGKTPAAADVSLGNRLLNKMVKAWQAKGLHMWTKEEGLLFLTPFVGQYDLGLSSTHFAVKDNTSTTQLSANMALGATTLTLESSSGMHVGDHLGVVKDAGEVFWTVISTIPDSTSVTIPGPGLPELISQNQLVYSYIVNAGKPLRILDARVLTGIDLGADGTSLVETPLTMISYQSFFGVGMTTIPGPLPNQAMYVPKDIHGRLYVWPRPTTGANRIQITYERMIDDLDAVNDEFDFPSEWLEPLTFQLAVRLATPFGKEKKGQYLAPAASMMLDNLLDWDCEVTSVFFQPEQH